MGTATECATAVAILRTGFQIREVSRFYTNRGDTILGRVYVNIEPLPVAPANAPTGPVQASAERTDRQPRAELDTGRQALPRSRGRGR